jgi:FixJ family two-component response regulator
MSGTQFMRAARERRPELPVVYITGYADPREVAQDAGSIIVRKPYRAPELLRSIEETLERSARSRSESGKVVAIRSTARISARGT